MARFEADREKRLRSCSFCFLSIFFFWLGFGGVETFFVTVKFKVPIITLDPF